MHYLQNIKAFFVLNFFFLVVPISFLKRKPTLILRKANGLKWRKKAMKTKKSIAFFAILANDFVENTKISCSKNV